MKCDKCGKGITDPDNKSLVAMELRVDKSASTHKEWLKSQVGKYELDRTYVVCWECLMDSIMLKDKEEK